MAVLETIFIFFFIKGFVLAELCKKWYLIIVIGEKTKLFWLLKMSNVNSMQFFSSISPKLTPFDEGLCEKLHKVDSQSLFQNSKILSAENSFFSKLIWTQNLTWNVKCKYSYVLL